MNGPKKPGRSGQRVLAEDAGRDGWQFAAQARLRCVHHDVEALVFDVLIPAADDRAVGCDFPGERVIGPGNRGAKASSCSYGSHSPEARDIGLAIAHVA